MKGLLKRVIAACALMLPLAGAVGCSESGGGETPSGLTLEPSKTTMMANGADRVTFKVVSGKEDVTARARIQYTLPDGQRATLNGDGFTTRTPGEYTFSATLGSFTSPAVKVTAEAVEADEKYLRRVCVMDLTSVNCTNCPNAARSLQMLSRMNPGRMIVMAVHGEYPGKETDPMITPMAEKLLAKFENTGFPMAVTDLRESVSGNVTDAVQKAYNTSLKEYPATCGVRLATAVEGGKLEIEVGVTSNTGGEYRVAVVVVEDGIVFRQFDSGLWNEEYVHNDTVRALLSDHVLGDALGMLEADKEVTRKYSVALDAAWAVENLKVVAYVTDGSESINNAVECKAGEAADYTLK